MKDAFENHEVLANGQQWHISSKVLSKRDTYLASTRAMNRVVILFMKRCENKIFSPFLVTPKSPYTVECEDVLNIRANITYIMAAI